MNIRNKTVIITGASQGLGRCLSTKLAALGCRLVLVSRNLEMLEKLASEVHDSGGEAYPFKCDIGSFDEVKGTTARILKQFRSVDILVNNAGIWTDQGIEKGNPEKRDQAFSVNSLGHINITEELLPVFRHQNYGHIFNVISTSGVADLKHGNNAGWRTYGASKWAMAGYTKSLRDNLEGTSVRVTGFYPGGFDSNLYENAGWDNAHKQEWMMKVEDVADVIVFALTRPDDVLIDRIVMSKAM